MIANGKPVRPRDALRTTASRSRSRLRAERIPMGEEMIALLSLVSLSGGVTLAVRAPLYPAWTARMETAGGLALIAGLAMVGVGVRASLC